jgi:glycosyltransferase involved in cell wall biosynthesis
MGGHAATYLDAWEKFLSKKKISYLAFEMEYSYSVPSNVIGRLFKIFWNIFETLGFWIPILLRTHRNELFLFLDAPCSYPVGVRLVIRFLFGLGYRKKSFIICHAFPEGGDSIPKNDNLLKWRSYFDVKAVIAHSLKIREFLEKTLHLPSKAVVPSSWGCDPVISSQWNFDENSLRILFFGQYRSSKGLEWFWSELQKIDFPTLFQVYISCSPQVGSQVSTRLKSLTLKSDSKILQLNQSVYFQETEVDRFFDNIDLLVIPYAPDHCIVSGLVYLAASHQCPVISSTHSESGLLPEQNGFGFSFAPYDSDGLRNCLERFRKLSMHEVLQLRSKAKDFAENYSWDRCVGDVFDKIISKHAAS